MLLVVFFGALILTLSYKLICHLQNKTFPNSKIVVSAVLGALLPFLIFSFLGEHVSLIVLYTAWPTIITAIIFTKKGSNLVEQSVQTKVSTIQVPGSDNTKF